MYKAMPRQIIYFTKDTFKQLKDFIEEKYGQHKAMSLTVQRAVKEFLEREGLDNAQNR